MSTIALYYPWMHFQNDSWVKLALLTWDKIARVRARGLEDRDSALVRQVRAESDLIMELMPAETDLDIVTEAFTAALDRDRPLLVERYGRDGQNAHYRREDARYEMAGSNSGGSYSPTGGPRRSRSGSRRATRDPLTFWVYSGDDGAKIDTGLSRQLVDAGLALADPDGGPWVRMRPKLGSIYLAALADSMSRNNLLAPVTDDLRMHRALGVLDQLTEMLLGRMSRVPALEDAESAYLHLALRAVIEPERLAAVPVEKLISFRRRHEAELAAFRRHVADLGAELQRIAAVENITVAQAHLQSLYQQTTKPQLDELRRALRGLGVESTAGALGLKVDLSAAAGTVVGGVAAAGGQLTVAGAAVAVTLIPYAASKVQARRQRVSTSPVAYLLAADRKLAGSSLLRAVHRIT